MRHAAPILFAAIMIVGSAVPAPAQQGDVASKRREAQRLEAQISEQATRLSALTEDFNEAAVERERLDARIAKLRQDLDQAERTWQALRSRLGERARVLYKHPALWAEPYLSARSVSEMARAQTLSRAVVMNDQDLLLQTEKARSELKAAEQDVASAQSLARAKERDMQARQTAVQRELRAYRASLSNVSGEIAELVEAQRARRETAAVSTRAEAAIAATAPAVGGAPRSTSSPAEPRPTST
ncbi:MAG TPA: hypothetical protein VM840_12440, partial [Actinomycetota bacterium]|nr:hypothetical protein [Actinomycetota bacterium]